MWKIFQLVCFLFTRTHTQFLLVNPQWSFFIQLPMVACQNVERQSLNHNQTSSPSIHLVKLSKNGVCQKGYILSFLKFKKNQHDKITNNACTYWILSVHDLSTKTLLVDKNITNNDFPTELASKLRHLSSPPTQTFLVMCLTIQLFPHPWVAWK